MSEGPRNEARRESVLQRKLTLTDMLDVSSFNELVKSFVELYKVGIKVLDDRGNRLADVKIGNGDFCGYVFSFNGGRTACTSTVQRVKDGPLAPTHGARAAVAIEDPRGKGLVALPCFTGLRYLMLPVMWDGEVLGRMIFGPFVPDDLQGIPDSLLNAAPDLDAEKAAALMQKVRRAPEGTVAKVMAHFAQLLETLVAAGQKTYYASQMHIEASLEQNRELEAKNRRLEEMYTKLKELDRLKSSFLATVSHELRTPLTSIIGYSEMLAEGMAGPLNGEQNDYVRTIMDKGESLLKLISSILDLSQIEAGKVRLQFAPLNVAEIVHQSVSSVKPQAQKKGITVAARVPAGNRVIASGDAEKLRQVVVNLLANAVKFTPKDGRISVMLSEIGPQPELGQPGYRILVEDSGVGIPPDQFDKIFQSFYQVDSSSTREFGGAGLGLAIVKSFVEGHGGTVRVSSELGHGARFTAVLPASPSVKPSIQITPPAANMGAGDRF